MKKHTIIGMAGHIDHGKTALIRAMTGIETDRLKEEQKRGITIDLGFAYWQENVTIIDVPGHEKFVRNMVAGVNTVDLFLLVIAADDGIMPQTTEHLEILKFFNVRRGVVALTKTDLVDYEWLELVKEEIHEFLDQHGFYGVPIIPVSSTRLQGIEQLRLTLQEHIDQIEPLSEDRPFRLNVDRSFSMKGFGTIVTGTVLSSEIAAGGSVEILPAGRVAKVRGIEVHQKEVERACSGQRAAINLAGVSPEVLPRGSVIVAPDRLLPSKTLLAKIVTVKQMPFKIKKRAKVRIHTGTAEILGTVAWYNEDSYLKNQQAYSIYLTLQEPCVAAPGDPVLLRSFSPVTTVAGGRILHIDPPRSKRRGAERQEYLEQMTGRALTDRLQFILTFSGYRAFSKRELQKRLFEPDHKMDEALQQLLKKQILTDFKPGDQRFFISNKQMDDALARIDERFDEKAVRVNRMQKRLNRKEIESLLKPRSVDSAFLERTLQKALSRKALFADGEFFTRENPDETGPFDQWKEKVADIYERTRFAPPAIDEIAGALGIKPNEARQLITALQKEGRLISIDGKFYLHQDIFDQLIRFLQQHFRESEVLEVGAFKTFVKGSRKYVIPLMEYLDNQRYTERQGDVRTKGPLLAEHPDAL